MQATPRVFATLDLGAATTATALIGRVDRRWRLLGALSVPATASPERVLEHLAGRVQTADPDLSAAVGLVAAEAADLPALVARSAPPATLAVLAASERALAGLAGVVARSGWRWIGLSAERHDAQAMTALLLDPVVSAVLVAVGDPPGGDERGALGLLGALTAAAAARRPGLTVVLAGSVARSRSRFPAMAGDQTGGSPAPADVGDADGTQAPGSTEAGAQDAERDIGHPSAPNATGITDELGISGEPDEDAPDDDAPDEDGEHATARLEPLPDGADPGSRSEPAGRLIIGPTAAPGGPAWPGLTELLVRLRNDPGDSRQAAARAAAGLAGALDRRTELLEIGFDGGLRAIATPGSVAGAGSPFAIAVADAALVPPELDEARLDRILGWSTLALDRHRLRDRLLELRAMPWAGGAGDGARLRLAAARAAMSRLVELTPDLDAGLPADLVVISGGAFAPAPPAAVLLAVADMVRRPAAYHVAIDHARLLGPLGTIEDPGERDRLLADLAGDLLVPLGAVVMPTGLRAGRRPGTVVVTGPRGRTELPLVPGALEHVELAAGGRASVVIDAGEAVRLGSLGRRIGVDVAGGLGGLLLDLRDVPLRLPDRREPRRELLLRWQETAWPGGAG